MDGATIWRIDQDLPVWEQLADKLSDGTTVLASDSRNRADVQPMLEASWEDAEQNKLQLEDA